jgi:UDP-glucose 4-epimerase
VIGIFGANGFMGRHLLRRLASRGDAVRAVSRHFDDQIRGAWPATVDFVEADFRDPIGMAAALDGLDVVVQLVSTSSPASQNRHATFDIQENVLPHVDFMQAAVDAGVRRYVFASSGGTVYGPGVATPTPEQAATNPICSHGLTKLTIENYLRMHATVDDLETVILRIANAFGPEQMFRKGQGLIPAVLNRVSQCQPVQVVGDGTAVRDYVFIDDVVDALEAAAKRALPATGVFNVGSGRGHTVVDVLDALERELGHAIERLHVPARRTDTDVSVLDISAAASRLAWRPRIDFREGIRRTVAWWQASLVQPDGRRAA